MDSISDTVIGLELAPHTHSTTRSLRLRDAGRTTLLGKQICITLPTNACLLIKPFCAPAGLNIDYYANTFAGYSSGKVPPSYYITEGLTPLDSSLTNETYFPQNLDPNGLPSVYPDPSLPTAPYFVGWTRTTNGGVIVDANNFTVVFYRAPVTGTYELCATADNEDALFFGDGNAFSCLDGTSPTDAEPVVISTGASFVNGINCTNVDLVQGFYYPVRNFMGTGKVLRPSTSRSMHQMCSSRAVRTISLEVFTRTTVEYSFDQWDLP